MLKEFPGAEVNEKPKAYNEFYYHGKNYFCTIYVQKRKIYTVYLDKEVVVENKIDFECIVVSLTLEQTVTPRLSHYTMQYNGL